MQQGCGGTGQPFRPPSPKEYQSPPPAWVTAVAGQVAGMAGLSVVHPLDTLKCRIQAHRAGEPLSPMSVFRSLVRAEGLAGLYKGVGAPLCAFGVINCVNFTVFSQIASLLEHNGALGTHLADGTWEVCG